MLLDEGTDEGGRTLRGLLAPHSGGEIPEKFMSYAIDETS